MSESSSQPQPTASKGPPITLEQVVIRFCGDSGDGMQLTGSEFTRSSALAGHDLATLPDFPAEIRAPAGTLAGVSGFQLHFANHEVYTPGDHPDVLVAMNPAALKANIADLDKNGILVLNSGAFTKLNLKKAGYETNPIDDASLDAYRVFSADMTKLTRQALAESGLGTKEVDRCKNFFALGLMFWLYNRPIESQVSSINKKFAKRAEIADANVKVFKAGYHYGETAEFFDVSYQVETSESLEPGTYRNITGNMATSIGLIAGAKNAGVELMLGGYPITPASDVLHTLSNYKHAGVTTFQAEDEIAGIGAAIGASYGGALGVTCSSGPGIALKGEALGLAVIAELPLVVLNVQRGGPSTGLPTKTEQADLFQALYGRNGECPMPVIAAKTPSDCFFAAIEACHVAIKYMTPVMLLSDGYLANGAEPWRIPNEDEIPSMQTKFRTEPEGYQVYERNEDTMARAWVKPGTPGLEHRIGGLEKDALTGAVSYDPENHEKMIHTRAAKVKRVQQEMGELSIQGDESGDLLVVGWGSTYGAIYKAVDLARREGKKVSALHLRWISPLHPKLGETLAKFKKIIVAEMNMGQLRALIRSEFLVDAKGLNKVQGKPFNVGEISAAIAKEI